MKKLICAVAVLAVSTAQADTIFVDASCPGGDGSELDPYCSIQTAIDNAVNGDEVVVAPGTYFEMIDFLGKAVNLHSSDGPEVTIIDAQQMGRVVICESGEGPHTVLEGFTITGGFDGSGGGMRNGGSSPTVNDCTFSGNSANGSGGGMYNASGSPTVTNCTFTGNSANGSGGGGMANGSSSPTLANCSFNGNSAGNGGGMYNFESNPALTNCTFGANTADQFGGGMYNNQSSPTVAYCTFSDNEATQNGGGMYDTHSSAMVAGSTFTGNSATNGGGGMYSNISSPTVTNCTFSGNSAYWGGGMYNIKSVLTVTNCTISGNTADQLGGGMFNSGSGSTVTNCILWGNSPDDVSDNATFAVTYSNIQDGWPGIGNIDADPLFVDPDNGDLRLSAGSPCIDAGAKSAVPGFVLRDLDGNPRFVADLCAGDDGPTPDMGAYEFQGTSCDLGTMLALLAAWGHCDECGKCPSDFDGDCHVGITDFLLLLGSWG